MSAFRLSAFLPGPATWQITVGILGSTAIALAVVSLIGARWRERAAESVRPDRLRVMIFRVLACGTAALGLSYIVWRYMASLNSRALWLAIPLVAAETYSLIDALLFIFMMWKPSLRVPPPALDGATVDVFITTYNEPVELVRATAAAARRIDWPTLTVHVLDDGARPELRSLARELGCGYVTRGGEWQGKPLHAKAGNVNNALMQTTGEFILILDADQIPAPQIVRRTIGYFHDPRLAFVQTPQYFYNIPPGDPFGTDAPLFYGPILRGKDGWNAAFFCGSNALLRRDALLQLGVAGYAKAAEGQMSRSLRRLDAMLARLARREPGRRIALVSLRADIARVGKALARGQSLEKASDEVRRLFSAAQGSTARADIADITAILGDLAAAGDVEADQARRFIQENSASLAREVSSGSGDVALPSEAVDGMNLSRSEEAIPVLPLATISVTEDMATAMGLHALGWRSVFHSEVLAYGRAPEDLGSALSQRLRWAQGTLQVLVRQNPLFVRGLSFPQRLQYFTTMYSYFSGFAGLVYILAPLVYLLTGLSPIAAWSAEFFWRLIPFLLINRLQFSLVARGLEIRRGEQFSFGLFPVWIRAVVSVFLGRKPGFVVTPKSRQPGVRLELIWPQLAVIGLTGLAVACGLFALISGTSRQFVGIGVNAFWACYNVVTLWALVRAAFYKPPRDWDPQPPAFLRG